jgi:hypothetical protein
LLKRKGESEENDTRKEGNARKKGKNKKKQQPLLVSFCVCN